MAERGVYLDLGSVLANEGTRVRLAKPMYPQQRCRGSVKCSMQTTHESVLNIGCEVSVLGLIASIDPVRLSGDGDEASSSLNWAANACCLLAMSASALALAAAWRFFFSSMSTVVADGLAGVFSLEGSNLVREAFKAWLPRVLNCCIIHPAAMFVSASLTKVDKMVVLSCWYSKLKNDSSCRSLLAFWTKKGLKHWGRTISVAFRHCKANWRMCKL